MQIPISPDQFSWTWYLTWVVILSFHFFLTSAVHPSLLQVPHWVTSGGTARELDANGVVDWLVSFGATYGWSKTSATLAQDAANQGRPTIVTYKNPTGIGHMGVIRPGSLPVGSLGPALAQAGRTNFANGFVQQGFGTLPITYWTHA
jgi:hypothetical protein